MNYQELLHKYSEPYVPGEKRSREYEREIKRKQRLKRRLVKLDIMLNEASVLFVNADQKKQLQFLIKRYSNSFKKLHGKASEETIILAFIFYLKKMDDPLIQIQKYRISKKYKLTHNTFETIIIRLTADYFSNKYIIPDISTEYDHEVLYETKGEI